MHSESGLESLMLAYQQGDLAAATDLVKRVSPQLHAFFAMQGTSRSEADDLLQETWLRVHQARHTYRRGAALLPWLYAIARHIRVDHFRSTVRHQSRAQTFVRETTTSVNPAQASANTPDLDVLLRTLPQSQREVIAMLKGANMSLEEVARATGCSVGSVKQKAHRAYEKLREQLENVRKRAVGGSVTR
jgi:RNA polymerase sigma-70 factor (ECF subfamily)